MLPLEEPAAGLGLATVIQGVLFVYLLASFVISVQHVYRVSWLVAAGKATAILLGYIWLVGGSLEAASYFMMPGSATLPFLTD